MDLRTHLARPAAALLLAIGVSGPASAGLLGHTLGIETQFPAVGTICCGSLNAVVGAGVEAPAGSFTAQFSQAAINASDTQINYSVSGGATYAGAPFNGMHFFDVFATIDPIINVTLDPFVTLPGFDASRISFDSDNVYINLQGLAADFPHFLTLNIEFGPDGVVPVPATAALFGLGLAVLGWSRRRRTR